MSLSIGVLVPLITAGSGGLLKHLKEVLACWERSPRIRSVTVYAPTGLIPDMAKLGVTVKGVPGSDWRHGFRVMSELADASEADVVVNTTARPVRLVRKPLVTMVRNMEPIQRPQYPMSLPWHLRLWWLRRETIKACKQSARVIAVSHAVKKELQSRFGVNPVDVVYHGLRVEASPGQPHRTLPEQFLFSAGSIVPYRGYEDLIGAVSLLRQQGIQTPPALIAGTSVRFSKYYEKQLWRLVTRLGVESSLVWLGRLSVSEMAWCYEHASVFVQTSRAESFSNIQVEAMGQGAVVISCTQPPMPEILGEAALFYETGNIEALKCRILEVLRCDAQRLSCLRAMSRKRACEFDWQKTADQTLASLEHAVEGFGVGPRSKN